jgi:hypothetical protein
LLVQVGPEERVLRRCLSVCTTVSRERARRRGDGHHRARRSDDAHRLRVVETAMNLAHVVIDLVFRGLYEAAPAEVNTASKEMIRSVISNRREGKDTYLQVMWLQPSAL